MAEVTSWLMLEGNVVTGRCQWDGDAATWAPPAGVAMVRDPGGVSVGFLKQGGKFVAPTGQATPEPFTVYKADIWRRCTDAEADKLDTAIRAQPVRLRRLFDDATNLRSDDELFGQISGAVVQMIGAERAAVVLAPSEEA